MVKGSLRAPDHLRTPWDHLEHQKTGSLRAPKNETFMVWLGDTGLGHGVGWGDQHGGMRPLWFDLGTRGWDMGWVEGTGMVEWDLYGLTWEHGAGTWGGFRGPAWWNETFMVWLGDTGLGHGVGLGDQHGGMRPLGFDLGTRGWDMGWV